MMKHRQQFSCLYAPSVAERLTYFAGELEPFFIVGLTSPLGPFRPQRQLRRRHELAAIHARQLGQICDGL